MASMGDPGANEWVTVPTECCICGETGWSVVPIDVVEPPWQCSNCKHDGVWPHESVYDEDDENDVCFG